MVEKKTIKISMVEKKIKKNQQLKKKSAFFFVFFFSTTEKTKLPPIFLFCFFLSGTERKVEKSVLRVSFEVFFEKKKKEFVSFFTFFIIK